MTLDYAFPFNLSSPVIGEHQDINGPQQSYLKSIVEFKKQTRKFSSDQSKKKSTWTISKIRIDRSPLNYRGYFIQPAFL